LPFEATLTKNHEFSFQEKFASFGSSNVQVSKKEVHCKGEGKKDKFSKNHGVSRRHDYG
jgi:hypothetical protein